MLVVSDYKGFRIEVNAAAVEWPLERRRPDPAPVQGGQAARRARDLLQAVAGSRGAQRGDLGATLGRSTS
jgi:hypothetical protein